MLLLLIYHFGSNLLFAAATENSQRTSHDFITDPNFRSMSSTRMMMPNHNPAYNLTYIDKTENVVRVPNIKPEEHKNKRKSIKKSPKRTIQKIIKKSKSRRRMYLNQATTTKTPMSANDLDNFYAQEDMLQRNENLNTTQLNQNKKKKKWNSRSRYPMPFQNLASRYHYKRNKRSDDREDVFILTDLDEIEFLDKNEEDNVVKAHIKKYW